MQIGAITVAIFLALLVGAAALTKALNRRQAQTDQKMQNKNSRKKIQHRKMIILRTVRPETPGMNQRHPNRQVNRFLSRSVWWVTVRWERI